ncbi:MAG: aromatic amino acid lyase [Pseudomonadota bacterium]
MAVIELTGAGLTPDSLAQIASGAEVMLSADGLEDMRASHDILTTAQSEGQPIYGVTTGLGPLVGKGLSGDDQAEMSRLTIRGRAHAVGAPLDHRLVRAAMAVRANTLLTGASGASPDLPLAIVACLNAGLSPVIREAGSVGAGDLMWGGALGLGLIGEGEMDTPQGRRPSADALQSAGLSPYLPGPRDGLAMAASSAPVAAIAALGLLRAEVVFESAQTAAALSLEAFRSNLSPLRFRVLALRPQPGQMAAAAGIAARLEGSPLHEKGAARRVQDPLSLRNIAQIHGAVVAALDVADQAVRDELNGASDNPVVLAKTGEVLSSGGFLTPHLAIVLGMLAQSFVHLAAAQVGRMAKLIHNRFSDLPDCLTEGQTGSAGVAPVMKSAEALFSEIVHLAQPAPVYPSAGADGVEDVVTHSAVPAKSLMTITGHLQRLIAIELLIAAQAVEMRGIQEIAPMMRSTLAAVRKVSPTVQDDRPLSDDIEALAEEVAKGTFEEPTAIYLV